MPTPRSRNEQSHAPLRSEPSPAYIDHPTSFSPSSRASDYVELLIRQTPTPQGKSLTDRPVFHIIVQGTYNPACDFHRTGLSTVPTVMAGLRRVQGLGIVFPRQRYRVTGTASRLNNSIPSAVIGRHRPSGVVNRRRTSFHLQRCSVRHHWTTRHQAKWASECRVCLHTACLK